MQNKAVKTEKTVKNSKKAVKKTVKNRKKQY
jgi:hypothetical protein